MIPRNSILGIATLLAAAGEGNDPTAGGGTAPEVQIPPGMRGQVFHFRKEKVKDPEGNELAETFKHPSLTIPLPVPTKEDIVAIFSAPSEGEGNRASEQKFIIDLLVDAFYSQVREQINDLRGDGGPDKKVTVNDIDYNKLTIAALANMPASERGSKVSDEDIKAFLADYVTVMTAVSGKETKKITAQANMLEKGLRPVKTDKKVLDVFDKLLAMWMANSSNAAEHQEVYDMLQGRIKKWMNKTPTNILDDIL